VGSPDVPGGTWDPAVVTEPDPRTASNWIGVDPPELVS
jgi:hypothetical protein